MAEAKQKTVQYDPAQAETLRTETALPLRAEAGSMQQEMNVVCVYPQYCFQKIDGFGTAMTETACCLLSRMDAQTRHEALSCWFGPGGMNARLIRIPIDSCDYSLEEYQAVPDPIADPELETFSISRDRLYVLPVVKEALALAGGELSVLMSPWSPPYQWKTPPEVPDNDAAVYGGFIGGPDASRPGRCFGGRLKPEYYGSWAKYLVKYVQAYLDEGIPVTMLSVQNESAAAVSWDSCVWSAEEESTFLRDHLYPAMKAAGLTDQVGIYIWDHNKERLVEFVEEMMDNGVADMTAGFAFHWYSGDHFDALSLLHMKYPDKILMHSESCPMHIPGKAMPDDMPAEMLAHMPPELSASFSRTPEQIELDDAQAYAHDILGDLNHGMQRWIDWNMIVDRTGGPRHVHGGFASPITAEDDGSYTLSAAWYYLQVISAAVQPGAIRVGSSSCSADVEVTAVQNPDGSIAVLFLNRSAAQQKVYLRLKGLIAPVQLPPYALSSVTVILP